MNSKVRAWRFQRYGQGFPKEAAIEFPVQCSLGCAHNSPGDILFVLSSAGLFATPH